MKKNSLVRTIKISSWMTAAVVIIFIVILSINTWDGTQKLESNIKSEHTLRILHELEGGLHALRVDELEYFVNLHSPALRNLKLGKWSKKEHETKDFIQDILSKHSQSFDSKELEKINRLSKAVTEYSDEFNKLAVNISGHSDDVTLTDLVSFERKLSTAQNKIDAATADIDRIIRNKVQINESNSKDLEKELIISTIISAILGIATIVALIFFAYYIPTTLKRNLHWLQDVLETVSMGKQQSKIESDNVVEEFIPIAQSAERLRISVNGMLDRLTAKNKKD